jgi:hypothetical protein
MDNFKLDKNSNRSPKKAPQEMRPAAQTKMQEPKPPSAGAVIQAAESETFNSVTLSAIAARQA